MDSDVFPTNPSNDHFSMRLGYNTFFPEFTTNDRILIFNNAELNYYVNSYSLRLSNYHPDFFRHIFPEYLSL